MSELHKNKYGYGTVKGKLLEFWLASRNFLQIWNISIFDQEQSFS